MVLHDCRGDLPGAEALQPFLDARITTKSFGEFIPEPLHTRQRSRNSSLARILSSLGAGSLRSCRIPSLRAVGRMGRGGNPEGRAASITRPPAPAGGTPAPMKQLLGLPKGEEEEAANTQLLPTGRGKEGHRHSVCQQELSTFSGFSYSHQKV